MSTYFSNDFSPIGVWCIRICNPPYILSHPGWPGTPAGNYIAFPLSKTKESLQKSGLASQRDSLTNRNKFQGSSDLSTDWEQGAVCGMSKFTLSNFWHGALETTAERKAAAIVLPCHKSCNPPPKHDAVYAFKSCLALHQKHFGFKNIPPTTAIADAVIMLKWKQHPLASQPWIENKFLWRVCNLNQD